MLRKFLHPASRIRRGIPALLLGLAHHPGSAQLPVWSYIRNDSVKLGVKLDYGAGVGYFAKTSSGRNLLNHRDHGRLLQQSYYGTTDGSTWNGKPWRWNPVQGGCWTGKASGIVEEFRNDGMSLYARTKPINWGGCEAVDATMEEWIELKGNVAVLRFRFTNGARDNPAVTHQEMPAVFVDYGLPNLVYYEGPSPWTDAPLTRKVPGWPNAGGRLDENWAAYVDDADWGIGVYVPGTSSMTYYRFEGDRGTGPEAAACSYFAPVRSLAVGRGFSIEYMAYLTIGSVPEIRRGFRGIMEKGNPLGMGGRKPSGGPGIAAAGGMAGSGGYNALGRRVPRGYRLPSASNPGLPVP